MFSATQGLLLGFLGIDDFLISFISRITTFSDNLVYLIHMQIIGKVNIKKEKAHLVASPLRIFYLTIFRITSISRAFMRAIERSILIMVGRLFGFVGGTIPCREAFERNCLFDFVVDVSNFIAISSTLLSLSILSYHMSLFTSISIS